MTTIESLKRNFDDLSKTFVDIGQEAGNLNILKDFITDILGYASFSTQHRWISSQARTPSLSTRPTPANELCGDYTNIYTKYKGAG